LLEIDLQAGENGSIPPALRDPAQFKIGQARSYFEGDRPDAPPWFSKREVKDVNVEMSRLQHQFGLMTPNDIFCFVRYPRTTDVLRARPRTDYGSDLFSDIALDAFRSALEDDDFDPISRVFKYNQLMYVKSGICCML